MFLRPGFAHKQSTGGTGTGGAGLSPEDHAALSAGTIHTPFNWVVANAAARNALVVTAADVYKCCWQVDTGTLYILTNHSPMTWSANANSITSTEGPAFAARRSTAQAFAANAASTVICDTELYDTNNCYDPATGRFTADRNGIYRFSAFSIANQHSASAFMYFIRQRGATGATFWYGDRIPLARQIMIISGEVEMLTGDYVMPAVNAGTSAQTLDAAGTRWAGSYLRSFTP